MKIFFSVVFTIAVNTLFACDFCGCFMGITPYDNHSNLSLIYRYKSFNGYGNTMQHPQLFPSSRMTSAGTANTSNSFDGLKHGVAAGDSTENEQQASDYENYNSIELHGKFFIHRRIELNAIIPFVMNNAMHGEESSSVQHIGDISLFVGFHLINKTMDETIQQRLILGTGIKLATGNYESKSADGDRIDFLMQSGTGSTDFLFYLNYIVGYKKWGINFNSTYKINGENFYTERIGNSTTNYLSLFYKFRQEKNLKVFPSVQAYYEYSDGLRIANEHQEATTMSLATVGVGVDLFYKQFALNASFQLPVYEKKFDSNMVTAGKLMVGITFNFNQKNYLLHKKEQKN